jgi:hypothetical protein
MAVRKTAKGAALKRWFKEDWKDVKVMDAVHLIADPVNEYLVKLQRHLEK